MNTSQKVASTLASLVATTVLLAACSGGAPPPAEATVNGVTSIDRDNGTAELSVSALHTSGTVVKSGNIHDVSATIKSGPSGMVVDANVCGDIASRGPISAILTLDASGSMSTTDPSGRRVDAANAFIERMQPDYEAAITSFEGSNFYLWQDFTSDPAALSAAVDQAAYEGGGTPLWDAMVGSIDFVTERGGTNKVVLIFTDGEDNASSQTPADITDAALANDVRVFMIGLQTGVSGLLDDVATSTGGYYEDVSNADDLPVLFNKVFNAAVASGCIGLGFSPRPEPGDTIIGSLGFSIDRIVFTGDFEVDF